ncbi:MAG: hypothetical protein N2109_01715 [Fimbriimonadales bacterium]|nr:hypothetical protein [Fimbriimonadales bacterium]
MVRPHWLRWLLVAVVAGSARLAPAPIADPDPKGRPGLPVYTDAERQAQQAQQRVFGEVGQVPTDTEREAAPLPNHEPAAADIVAAAGREVENRGQGKNRTGGGAPWSPALLLGLLGVAAYGTKIWIERRIPLPNERSARFDGRGR